ncbi:MAG: WXG100 family type VII secretion target [Anaerolineae bacterium]|nr:WXG100 family type VII secretion target [Thermoflexales bacterium]MDW8396681.1 WXG100 family type VII secretion target [Anaerolineae bacterium]
MTQIRMSYVEMRQVADDFRNRAVEVQQILSLLAREVDQLFTTWEGAAETTFMMEWSSCRNKLQDTPPMLDEISRALHQTAQTIQEAEERARNITQSTIVSDNPR